MVALEVHGFPPSGWFDPTAPPDINGESSGFVAHSSDPFPVPHGGYLVTNTYGRQIEDVLQVTPVAGEGNQVSLTYEYYFCMCRDADGEPISDPAVCALPPHNCTLDPMLLDGNATEAPAAQGADPGKRAWYRMSVTYPDTSSYLPHPGATAKAVWDFAADVQEWTQAGLISVPAPDAVFGPGTDLAGLVWMHGNPYDLWDSFESGILRHGMSECPLFDDATSPCTITDSFVTNVAPDRRTTSSHGYRIPVLKPAPWWTYCAPCGDGIQLSGDILVDRMPMPLIAVDPAEGLAYSYQCTTLDVRGAFSPELMRSLGDPGQRLVGASEPLAIASGYDRPRALVLSADGTAMLGRVVAEGRTLALRDQREAIDTQARIGFGAVYSRTTGALYVLGGTSPSGAPATDMMIYRSGAPVERRLLEGSSRDRGGSPRAAGHAEPPAAPASRRTWVAAHTHGPSATTPRRRETRRCFEAARPPRRRGTHARAVRTQRQAWPYAGLLLCTVVTRPPGRPGTMRRAERHALIPVEKGPKYTLRQPERHHQPDCSRRRIIRGRPGTRGQMSGAKHRQAHHLAWGAHTGEIMLARISHAQEKPC